MDWILSPAGLAVLAVVVLVTVALIYWKRKSIIKWFHRQKISEIELGSGPVKIKLKSKERPKPTPSSPTGVDFGEGGDFTGARIHDMAGRDIRRGSAAAESPGGRSPGVRFGKKGQFRDAEIENVAGRDLEED